MSHADRRTELLSKTRQPRRTIDRAPGVTEKRLAERWHLQSREHCAHVAERLMECRSLDRLRVEQLWPQRIEYRVPHLVTADVWAFPGEIDATRHRIVEEMQT